MNSAFPTICTLSDILPHIANKAEILVKPGPSESTVACYQFQDSDTFDNPFAAECRGIVFDRNGDIAARPLHKFFNLGERPGSEQDLESAVRVMDKRDGSMIHTVWLDGQLLLKSKKCWDNTQTRMAWEWLNRPEHSAVKKMCQNLASNGMTAIFELTSPTNRIVVGYDCIEMQLLHVRFNRTGDYATRETLSYLEMSYGVQLVEEFTSSTSRRLAADALDSLDWMKNAEGYVFQFPNGDMVKLKCDWYLNLHRTISFTRERDIAEAAVEERLDDIKSALATIGTDLGAVNAVESKVKRMLLAVRHEVESILAEDKPLDRKSFALKHKDGERFGLVMAAYQGREPDYNDWFRKHVLKQQFSLEPVGAQVADE